MENHLCICKRWSWKPITGTHWSSVERPSAGLDYWPLRFISPQSPGNYAPSPNMHTHKHTEPGWGDTDVQELRDSFTILHHLILKDLWSPNGDGEIKMRVKMAFTPSPEYSSFISTEPTGQKKGERGIKKRGSVFTCWSALSVSMCVWSQVKALSECCASTR